MNERNHKAYQIIGGILIALFSAAVAWAVSTSTMFAQVNRHEQSIRYLEQTQKEFKQEMLQFRVEFTERVKLLVDTINQQTATTRDLITLIKLQQGVKP